VGRMRRRTGELAFARYPCTSNFKTVVLASDVAAVYLKSLSPYGKRLRLLYGYTVCIEWMYPVSKSACRHQSAEFSRFATRSLNSLLSALHDNSLLVLERTHADVEHLFWTVGHFSLSISLSLRPKTETKPNGSALVSVRC